MTFLVLTLYPHRLVEQKLLEAEEVQAINTQNNDAKMANLKLLCVVIFIYFCHNVQWVDDDFEFFHINREKSLDTIYSKWAGSKTYVKLVKNDWGENYNNFIFIQRERIKNNADQIARNSIKVLEVTIKIIGRNRHKNRANFL